MWLSILRSPLNRIRQIIGSISMADDSPTPPPKKQKVERQLDFKKFAKRHVALMISYLGWDYYGLVVQPNVEPTIESALREALLTTKLLESFETANFKRCGRTDKGVSAFRQVISLDVRSIASQGEGVFIPDGHTPCPSKSDETNEDPELNYMAILNRVLPGDIRILAWAPVPLEFTARFNCLQRTYKYFFPKANLNIEAMVSAAQQLVGTHDFRNFCKMDLSRNFMKDSIRDITRASIDLADADRLGTDPYAMYALTISANSFLWHQIRNIVTVLLLVGEGKEEPDVVTELLDIEAVQRKPQYSPASEIPLILYDCQYENLKWRWDTSARRMVISKMQSQWVELAVKAQMLKSMCDDLAREAAIEDPTFEPVTDQVGALLSLDRRRNYIQLLKRHRCGRSFEDNQAKAAVRWEKKQIAKRNRNPVSEISESG